MSFPIKWPLLLALVLWVGGAAGQPRARAVVRGQVLHPTDSLVFLARPRSLLDPTPVVVSTRLSPQGTFEMVLDSLRRPEAVQWGHGRKHDFADHHYTDLWLAPGDTLILTVDARHFGQSLRFAGRNAAPNAYRTAQRQARTGNFYDAPEGRPTPRTPARMRALADHYRQRAEAVLRAANRRQPLPPAFRRQEAAAIRYAWGHALLGFPYEYEYKTWGTGPVLRRLPAAYYAFLAEVPLPQDSLLAHRDYREFAGSYVGYLLRERRQRLTFAAFLPPQFPWAYDTVRQVLPAGPTRDYLLAQTLATLMRAGREADLGPLLADFRARCADPELLTALARQEARLAETRAGQPAPDFALTDLKGQPVQLADFRGKLVYLDVWASWCKPCRAEAPALRTLQGQFAAQADRVVFVSLSVDENAAAWRRAVAADHLAGAPNQAQVLGPAAEPALRRLWQQRGIPQYWLLSREGRILDSNAPRPSDPAATQAIETALRASKPGTP